MKTETPYAPPVFNGDSTTSQARAQYVQDAIRNLEATSRTANGTVDTSASATKADVMKVSSGQEAADVARHNFEETIGDLYDHKDIELNTPDEVRNFVEGVALSINRGITQEDVLYRSGADSTKYAYTRIADLEAAMSNFSQELHEKLSQSTNARELAGWIEYRIDMTDHFFADGCGKVAKAMGAWALMRGGERLPVYRDRKELYAHSPDTIRGDDTAADEAGYNRWMQYYQTLFQEAES